MSGYRDHLDRTFRLGTGENGVFGAKLMWRHMRDFQALAGGLPEYAGLGSYELLEAVFERPRYIWVTRHDRVRQAVSLWRALQTRVWRQQVGADDPRPTPLQYRFEGIDYLVRELQQDDEAWRTMFERNGAPVLRVVYEDQLEQDRDAAVRIVLDHIGVRSPRGWRSPDVMQRQSDALSDEWVAAYHRDLAARGDRAALSAR